MIRFRPNPTLIVLSALFCLAAPYAAAEDRYKLVAGKKNSLCQKFSDYLEQATQENIPPNCQTEFGTEFPEFAAILWREVVPKNHLDLAVQAYRYLNYWPWNRPWVATSLAKPKEQTAAGVELQYKHGWWRMWLAEADIDNDGRPDKLLKVEDGRCGDRRPPPREFDWRVPVMVLNESQTDIDTVRSELILGVSVLPPLRGFEATGLHGIEQEVYDVFLYGDGTYSLRWQDDWPLVVGRKYDRRYAAVTVYRIQRGKTATICRFKVTKRKD